MTVPRPRPPRLASWLVDLFCSADQAECILGDFEEEFLDLASKSGVATARSWYWRQTLKAIPHLALSSLRSRPVLLAGAVLFGSLLSRLASSVPEQVLIALLRTQRPYSNQHVEAYVLFVTYGIPAAIFLQALFIGFMVALLAKGKEMVATITLTFICGLPTAQLIYLILVRKVEYGSFLELGPYVVLRALELSAMVVAGVMVRKFRSRAATRPAVT